jgi:hypothetical protein
MSYAALAAAGISAVSGLAQASATGKLNRKNREWQEEMWQKTNDYNLPSMQMARLKAAGLNPHLIYGQGNVGNATMASAPQQTNQDFSSFATAAQNYVSNRKQQVEIDNLKKAQEVMDADKQLKNSQSVNQLAGAAKTEQEKNQAGELFNTVLAQSEANLRNTDIVSKKLESEIGSILAGTDLAKQQTRESGARIEQIEQNVKESAAKIKSMMVDNNLKGAEIELKKVELGLRKAGINPNDPAYIRILGRIAEESGLTNDAIKEVKTSTGFFDRGVRSGHDVGRKFRNWIDKMRK